MRTTIPPHGGSPQGRWITLLALPLVAFAAILGVAAPLHAASPDHWARVAPAGAGFSVLMPGSPAEQTSEVPTRVGITIVRIFIREVGSNIYMTSYNDYPASSAIFDAQAALDGARDGAIRNTLGAVLLTDVNFTFDGYPAKGIVVEVMGGKLIYRSRMYLVGTRLYQTAFAAPPRLAHNSGGNRFLGSFRLRQSQRYDLAPLHWQLSPTKMPPPIGPLGGW